MRATLEIDERKLREFMQLLGATSKTEAINAAIDEALRSRARARLKQLAGTVRLAEDWRELRELERGK